MPHELWSPSFAVSPSCVSAYEYAVNKSHLHRKSPRGCKAPPPSPGGLLSHNLGPRGGSAVQNRMQWSLERWTLRRRRFGKWVACCAAELHVIIAAEGQSGAAPFNWSLPFPPRFLIAAPWSSVDEQSC